LDKQPFSFAATPKNEIMSRIVFTCFVVITISVLTSCKSPSTTTSTNSKQSKQVDELSARPEKVRSITVGDPQNNSAVALIMSSEIGGNDGAYISKQMDIQATEIGHTEMKGVKILRVGEGIKITFDGNLMFEKNSSDLSKESQKNLDRVAETLVKYNNSKLIIEGHTDGTGPVAQNQILSEQRAQAVAKYLVANRVDPKKIKATGYGETQPLFGNSTEEGRIQNRRVELIIIADDVLREEAKNKSASN
jgi:outer membrane protein OmpA-like peptidoglycan-associated protein